MSVFSKERLEEFEANFKKVSKDGPDYPLGTPTLMQLTDAVCDVTGNGKEIIKQKWTILEGEHEGQIVPLNIFPLASDMGMTEFKKWASVLGGYEDPAIYDMEEIVAAISNQEPVAKIQLRKSGTFINADILERVDASEVTPPTTTDESTDDTAEEPPEEAAEDDTGVEIGSTVQFETDDGTAEGEVTAIDGTALTIDCPDFTAEADVSEVTLVETKEGIDDSLRALAEAVDVDIVEDDTDKSLAEKLKNGFDWKEEDLDADEVKLLKSFDIPVIAKKKKIVTKKKVAKKKVAKKTVKKKAKR